MTASDEELTGDWERRDRERRAAQAEEAARVRDRTQRIADEETDEPG